MARDRNAQCRVCRRAGVKLYLKGERCFTTKCAIVKRNYPPGVQGVKKSKPRLTPYGIQLREKQKAKMYYGMSESQFRRYFDTATKKTGDTSVIMQQLLESRLDNVVYRLGLVHSRKTARELVSHGHITVDGGVVTIPSFQVRIGSIVAVREQKKKSSYFQNLPKVMEKYQAPSWLHSDIKKLEGKIVSLPTPEDAAPVYDIKYIVEFYSR
ncbi:30S ribosomal protein S4 [Candidatus Uhrbacteria bacterium]|nr:30S ribosomal protein S4 [Candidatus Uhrbacteria bacterium]